MWAAKHLDLVSGFAVAVGVSTAMLTGYGVAAADTGSPGTSANSSSAAHAGPSKASASSSKTSASHRAAVTNGSAKKPETSITASTASATETASTTETANALPAITARFAPIRTQKTAATPTATSLTTTASGLTVPTAATSTSLLASVVNDIFNPASGNSPTAPPASPTDWIAAAATRRELAAAAVETAPTFTFTQGVIYGNVNGTGTSPLTYSVIGAPNAGGKVTLNATNGSFSFLPDLSVVQNQGTETFQVLAHETTPLVTALVGIPVVGSLIVQPVVMALYQVPVLSDLLAPLIGASTITNVVVPVGTLVGTNPVAFTTKIPSVHGAMISVNWFPALGLTSGDDAATILNGPGLGAAGNIDPSTQYTVGGLVPGLPTLRDGYNVITWDPRGEFASTGILQLDSPAYEGQDVSAIIDWAEGLTYTQKDGTGDPLIGMVGGSYGGGIQLVAAGIDKRIDAIVPGIAWNNLTDSLYPRDTFKTSYASLLLLSLVTTGARINTQIYEGIVTGDLLGVLTESQQALLNSSGPDFLLGNITAPTLFIQGTVDVLFPLAQSIANSQGLNPDTPTKMIWFCGGHGACLTLDATQLAAQSQFLSDQTMDWLDKYVKGENIDEGPAFQWIDQNGNTFQSDKIPTDPGFNLPSTDDLITTGGGGILPIVPLIGGSGPQNAISLPYSLGLGAPATNAITVPLNLGTDEANIVAAPVLTMTYSGIGTSRSVYAQIVDEDTGQVVGNIVTPIPVTLNGQEQTVEIPMEYIAYTVNPNGQPSRLSLQIVTTATPFLNFTQYGVINVSGVSVSLPVYNTANNAVDAADLASVA